MTDTTQQKPEIVTQHRFGAGILGEFIDKPVTLQLQYNGLWKAYQVVSITSTVLYKPGEWLSPDVVDKCCTQKGWSVTMIHDDWLAKILGIFGGSVGAAAATFKTIP